MSISNFNEFNKIHQTAYQSISTSKDELKDKKASLDSPTEPTSTPISTSQMTEQEKLAVQSGVAQKNEKARKQEENKIQLLQAGRNILNTVKNKDKSPESLANTSENLEFIKSIINTAANDDYSLGSALEKDFSKLVVGSETIEAALDLMAISLSMGAVATLSKAITDIDKRLESLQQNLTKTQDKEVIQKLNTAIQKLQEIKTELKKKQVSSGGEAIATVVRSGGSMVSLVSVAKETMGKAVSPLLGAGSQIGFGGASVISVGTGCTLLVKEGSEYWHLNTKLKEKQAELDTLKQSSNPDSQKIADLEAEIKELTSKSGNLQGSLLTNSMNTTKDTVKTVSYAAQIAQHASHLTPMASHVLPAVGSTGSVATGVATAVLSSKKIKDNFDKDAKIFQEMERLKEQKKTCDPVLHTTIDMRLKNLEEQLDTNLVDVIQNSVSLCSGALGTSAGIMTVILASGATVAVGVGAAATATGIGAGVAAGVVVGIGIVYFFHKNQDNMSMIVQEKYSQAVEWKLKREENIRENSASSTEKKVQEFHTKVYDAQNVKKEESDLVFSHEVENLEELIKINQDASLKEKDPARQKLLEKKIQGYRSQIKSLHQEKAKQALMRAEQQHKDVKNLTGQKERLAQTQAALIESNAKRKQAEEKTRQIQEQKANYHVSSKLKNVSVDEVAQYRADLKNKLADPKNEAIFNEYLKSENIEVKNKDLTNAVMGYLIKAT